MPKPWPKDPCKTVRFSLLTGAVRKAIKFAYKLERKNTKKDIPWTTYDQGGTTHLSAEETLTKKNLDWSLEDQGIDALDEIIGVAIRLGIEQGKRIEKE